MSSIELDPYEALGNAVVVQAAKDYRDAVKKLSRGKRIQRQKVQRQSVRDSLNRDILIYLLHLMGMFFFHS